MYTKLKLLFCTFFTGVMFMAAAPVVYAETWEHPLSPEDTVAAVVTLIDEGRAVSAYRFFEMVMGGPIPDHEGARERAKIAGAIFRSSQWRFLPAAERLNYLRVMLAHGPVTARLQRELIFLAASIDEIESVEWLMDYGRNPWTREYYQGDDIPSLLPPWKILWSATRRGPVRLLKGTGFVSPAEISEVIRAKVCETNLSTPSSRRRSGIL